jgi:ATP-dependent helicase HepA
MNFVVGQRWLCHADSELGLGIVTDIDTRRVTLHFPAVGEDRTYASNNAPLSRVTYREGELIRVRDTLELTVTAVNELRGLLIYSGVDAEGREHVAPELQLNAHVQLTTPLQRLTSGQADSLAAYQLRVETFKHVERQQHSNVAGLLGARTSLLPHQIYIAAEVASRFAPRVLLADEVGLGKTIEAGLILHQQLHTGRASRVLIVVPTPLLHQWLVEMLRKFNLRFSIFDSERFAALKEESESDNPFDSEQLVLCSLEWLSGDTDAQHLAQTAGWDLLIVDEAHHLHWAEDKENGKSGASADYLCIENLAAHSSGLLLLTATPEQAGIDSHFARLRLLDPARYNSLARFKDEEANYQNLNALVQKLLDEPKRIPPELKNYLSDVSGDTSSIIRQLLDRHGTGRVLFRNTRAAVAGFPERHVHSYPLARPELYDRGELPSASLYPETAHSATKWLAQDPRVNWLELQLKKLRPAKTLVICAHAETAIALEQQLHLRAGIRCAAFHENLSIIERDRAAAWFAETELGAQALVCSEIGSEGRNFQFAQHLVLFDLPLNPDLLEQRIGRLDRIGQGPRIDIHVPYLEDSAQSVLFHWYHQGLDLFRQSFSAGFSLYEFFAERLHAQLHNPDSDLDTLIADTQTRAAETRLALQQGRDALLELSSCNREVALTHIAAIQAEEDNGELQGYMERLWDYFGVDCEEISAHAVSLRKSDHMLTGDFPELGDDDIAATFSRTQALSREDMTFLSWEHPMVTGAIDTIVTTEHGNACIASISIKGLQPGTLLLEAIYTISCAAPKQLGLEKFLSVSPIRTLVDISGKSLGDVLSHTKLNGLCKALPRNTAQAVAKQVHTEIQQLVAHNNRLAEQQLPALIDGAAQRLHSELQHEGERLRALKQVNPAIRENEIEFFERQLAAGDLALKNAGLQLQALRLVINA